MKGTVNVIHTAVNNCRPVVCTLKEVAVSGPVYGGTLIPVLGTGGRKVKSSKSDHLDKMTQWIKVLGPEFNP